MSILIDEALHQINLKTLAELSAHELQQRRRGDESADDRYCIELFRRALVEQMDEAWSALQQCFSETVRSWLWSHPGHDVALRRDSEENYVAQTFSRFWYAVHSRHVEFSSLNAALSYLHATLNGILTDTLRSQLRSKNVPLPEPGFPEEPALEENHDSQETWEIISSLLTDERERRVAYLLYYCGLKPREVVVRCPQEFSDVKEVYRLNHNIIDRLRRNQDRLRWLLGTD